uniref:Piezo-type mechanosensitive ion channel component n=1 Tax=Culex pipiens TaxID=7175 RepID=A0A8D8C813_CULPI
MANYFICLVVQRLILPLILAICCLLRPVGLSLPYLIFLLALPFVPVATPRSIKGSTGIYFKIYIAVSILLLLGQIAFQIVFVVLGYELIEQCQFTEILLRHVGLVKFEDLNASMVVYWIAPEIIMTLTSGIVYGVLKKLANGAIGDEVGPGTATSPTSLEAPEVLSLGCGGVGGPNPVSREKLAFLTKLGVVLSVAMLCLAAVLQPSVPSGIYFVIFLGSATWWACYKELDRAFGVVLRITLVFLVVHITGFLAYQNPWPQELLPANGTLARIFSLTPILSSSCDNLTDIRNVNFESDLGSDYYLNPVVLLLCYYCISITSSLLLRPRHDFARPRFQHHHQPATAKSRVLPSSSSAGRSDPADERTPLMRGGTRRVRDASSSDAQPSIQNDTIAMHTIEEDDSTSFFEQIMLATGNVASFIYKNSYIFTNVIMMTWSIMYHSWLTFVLLIWANLIWIMPNQRKNMLNSSPFLVIYAELLLLAQYLYGMKLTDDELPSTVNITGINLAQIGFIKYRDYPSSPLLIKSLFTTMFWISLRQMIQEKQMERRTSAIADLAAPLQVTVGAATTGTAAGRPLEKKSSAFITRAGTLINSFLIKFWIWVVAITLFLSGMTGTRMTGFRIVYMALFLIFVLTFQFSFKVWRKMMYAFWLTVIVYSMAILVLVYTYQFDKFPLYWKEYLKISDTLQKDIGLQIYETKQLFLHLVNPTMIVIITVIQLHYCHKKFLEISEIPVIQDNEIPAISETSSAYGTFSKRKKMSNTTEAPPIEKDPESDHGDEAATGKVKLPPTDDKDDDDNTSEILDDLRFRKLSKQEIKGVAQKLVNRVMQLTELVWLFAEIHLLKIILIVAFSLGVETVSFLHLLYVFMTVFAVKSHTNSLVLITRIMSLISSILLITTMMYQVEYIKEANFVSECPNIAANSTDMDMNNAKWFGFQKTDALSSLADLLRPYLIYIIVVTIHAVVVLRQTIRRIRLGQSPRTPHLMFPNVTRSDADKDIPRMIKYLFNYGFYKFGVEISLVSLISLIAYRMDVFSCLYAVWVCVMFHMTRDSLRKMWRFLTWFTVSLIPLQYVIFIGLPPALCVDYPWDIPFLDHFRIWAMLPENTEQFRSKAPKMVSDFLLLMFLCRQTLVFRIEARYNSCPDDFGGGSNKSVLDDIDKLGTVPFINPTPDFIAKVRNWLDISKRGIFLVFFWCTLAIVFLTGSSRVTLFSIGYLIGSFTFLWQGTDFYLRPIRAILKTWNMLIAYNVFVITTKTLLQMIGCLYLTTLTEKNCWLVQLLGVSCLSNPPVEEASTDPLVLAPTCKVPYSDSGLFWDGFCFAFLLVQRRIFSSHYFCHIINETKASTILASRGAELIEDLRIKDVKKEAERESQILQKIKMKMDRIKATQQKILEPVHDPTTHAKAIRSGDYYMFEDTEHEFELDLMQPRDSDEEFEKKGSAERRLSRRHLTLGKDVGSGKRKSDDDDEPDGQKPSTSKGTPRHQSSTDEEARLISDDDEEGDEEIDVEEATKGKAGKRSKFSFSGLTLVTAFLAGALGSLTLRLHRVSRSYRYVMKVLAKEKKILKETPGFGAGMRTGTSMIWTPIQGSLRSGSAHSGASSSSVKSRAGTPIPGRLALSRSSVHNSNSSLPRLAAASDQTQQQQQQPEQSPIQPQAPPTTPTQQQQPPQEQQLQQPSSSPSPSSPKVSQSDHEQTPTSVVAHHHGGEPELPDEGKSTELIEGDKSPKDDVSEEDFASQEHSVIVEFLQAAWYAILSHTDFICYFLVFLNQVKSASLLSLPLPLMVTLWGTLTFPRPSKNFWVTLIAYTQTIVILKCVCQFDMLWWNQREIAPNQPFAPARIIGIEHKEGYATYDLALLLVLFCHRFILKSLGLWKSDFVDESEVSEGFYKLDTTDEKTKALIKAAQEVEKDRESLVIRQETTELSMVKVEEGTEQQQLDQQEPNGNGALVCVTHHAEEAGDYFPQIVKHSCLKYTDSVKAFFNQLLDRQSRKTADVYGYLFLCDFINFFVILFGFSAFGTQEGDGGVLSYFEENKVPMTFLLMLIIQFFLIVVDRALYLRKYMVGKILFQFFLIIGIHIWMFFVLPATTERSFNATNPPVYYYLIKCFYLLFSAYQIRCGYPARILGNFVTKGFTMINFTGFKLFMTIPFLFELRTLMDWIWTDTSMTLFDWLKMEDIFSNVYQLKCMRQLEEDLPAPRGQKKGSLVKYLMGGGMMLGIILLIWFPLALFAFSNAVGEPNLPYDVSVTLRIGPYEPVYVMSAQDSNIHGLNEDQWEQLLNNYSKSKTALTFLSNYESVDVAAVKLGANSTSIWNISPPDKERLLNDLNGTVTLTCRFRYTISRKSHSKENPGTVSEEQPYELRGDDPVRPALVQMLATDSNISVTLPYLMPKFLKVKNSGNVKPIHQLVDKVDSDDSFRNYRNITLRLFQTHQNNSVPLFWWEVKENCTDNSFVNMPYADCLSHLVMYMFNDKIFPSTISSIAAGGIIGIYSTLILVFSRMLRTSIFSGASSKIMFEDLPYVDRVLQLCLDIYLVRESLEFTLEEDLFAKLIFLYRSPETMIKWTRPKNEDGDDESDSMSTSSKSRKKND